MPLAVYILRNYMGSLPREVIEVNRRMTGPTVLAFLDDGYLKTIVDEVAERLGRVPIR